MAEIALFYGTTTGNTQEVSEQITEAIEKQSKFAVDLFNIADTIPELMKNYKKIIVGCPTWYSGELQDDWAQVSDSLNDLELSDTKIAIFGLGDQFSYSDAFCSAIGILGKIFRSAGAELVGSVKSDDSYTFDDSEGFVNGEWMGLALDQVNQDDLTEERINKWIAQILPAFGLNG